MHYYNDQLTHCFSNVHTMLLNISLFTVSEVATGRSEVPYDSIDSLGVQVYGMPPGVPFHSPLLYNQQQLQQILANLEKIVFLKTSTDSTSVSQP